MLEIDAVSLLTGLALMAADGGCLRRVVCAYVCLYVCV